jgi:uncharacterized protein
MIPRRLSNLVLDHLEQFPAVALLGPRQVGKTTLAEKIAANRSSIYLDFLVDLLLVRRLMPWHGNTGKRQVKSPRVYVRDSGIVHALLGIGNDESLLGHPVVGASWEGFVIQNLLTVAPERTLTGFYRTSAGAEIDLLLQFPNGELWAIEIKRGLISPLGKGFRHARADLDPSRCYVVYSGQERYCLETNVEVISLREMMETLAAL